MNDIFISSFLSMGGALARIFIIIIFAGILVRKKVISQVQIDALSKITVIVLLPSLVFSNTLQHFNPESLPYWWILPIMGVVMSLVGVILASGVFSVDFKKKMNYVAISSMQNAGYLVLPIGQVVYPEHFAEFALFSFLFILGYNPVLWTLGKYMSTATDDSSIEFNYKTLITPPAVANVTSLILVLLGWQNIFPKAIVSSVDLLGQAAVPIATFILGATLGSVSLRKFPHIFDVLRVIFVKYALLPLTAIFVLYYLNLGETYPLLSDFFVIQATAAPATGLIIQVRAYGGDVQKVAGMMIVAYVVCLVAMPFWIAIWHTII